MVILPYSSVLTRLLKRGTNRYTNYRDSRQAGADNKPYNSRAAAVAKTKARRGAPGRRPEHAGLPIPQLTTPPRVRQRSPKPL
jgi:hypothetical protein